MHATNGSHVLKFEWLARYETAALQGVVSHRSTRLPNSIPLPKEWRSRLAATSLPRIAKQSVARLVGVPTGAVVTCEVLGVADVRGQNAAASSTGCVSTKDAFIRNPLLWPSAADTGGDRGSHRDVWTRWTWGEQGTPSAVEKPASGVSSALLHKLLAGHVWPPPKQLNHWLEDARLRRIAEISAERTRERCRHIAIRCTVAPSGDGAAMSAADATSAWESHREVVAVWTWGIPGRDGSIEDAKSETSSARQNSLLSGVQCCWVPPRALEIDALCAELRAAVLQGQPRRKAVCELVRIEPVAEKDLRNHLAVFKWRGVYTDEQHEIPYETKIRVDHLLSPASAAG